MQSPQGTVQLALGLMLLVSCGSRNGGRFDSGTDAIDSASADAKRGKNDAAMVCKPGSDQSCNDDPTISSLHGHCTSDGICMCNSTFAKNPATGLCQ